MQPMANAPPPTRPKGGIAIGIGIALIVLGIVGGVGGAVLGFKNLQNRIDDLQRVPISQGGELRLAESGTYKVYLERPEAPSSGVPVRIMGPDGNNITISRGSTSESYDIGGRHGMLLGSFRAPEPGRYQVSVAGYSGEPGSSGYGQIAVGRRSPLGALFGIGGAVFGAIFAGIIGIILIIVGGVRRSRSKRPPTGGYPGAGPGWGAPAPAGAGGWIPPPGQAWTPPAGPGPPPPPPGTGPPPAQPAWTPPQTGGNTTWNPPPR